MLSKIKAQRINRDRVLALFTIARWKCRLFNQQQGAFTYLFVGGNDEVLSYGYVSFVRDKCHLGLNIKGNFHNKYYYCKDSSTNLCKMLLKRHLNMVLKAAPRQLYDLFDLQCSQLCYFTICYSKGVFHCSASKRFIMLKFYELQKAGDIVFRIIYMLW